MSTTSLVYDETKDDSSALLVSFRSGKPEMEELVLQQFKKPGVNGKSAKRLVLGANDTLIFQGSDFGSNKTSNQLNNYAIGVLDKDTDEIEMYNIPHVFIMNQLIRGYNANVDTNTGEELTRYEQREALIQNFGSKMGQRIVKSLKDGQIHADNISGASGLKQILKRKIEETNDANKTVDVQATPFQSKCDSQALDATRTQQIPPYDLQAKHVQDVYKPEWFLKEEQLTVLEAHAREFVEVATSTSVQNYVTSCFALAPYIQDTLERIPKLEYANSIPKIGYTFYLGYLMTLYGTRFPLSENALSGLEREKGIPLAMLRHLMDLFANKTTKQSGHVVFSQPKECKDKLLLYICTMALVVRDFSVDLDGFGAAIKRSSLL